MPDDAFPWAYVLLLHTSLESMRAAFDRYDDFVARQPVPRLLLGVIEDYEWDWTWFCVNAMPGED